MSPLQGTPSEVQRLLQPSLHTLLRSCVVDAAKQSWYAQMTVTATASWRPHWQLVRLAFVSYLLWQLWGGKIRPSTLQLPTAPDYGTVWPLQSIAAVIKTH